MIGRIREITVTRKSARYGNGTFFTVRYWKWIFDRGGIENGLITTSEVLRIGFQHREALAIKSCKKVTFHRNRPGTGDGKLWRGKGDWWTP